MKKEELEKVTIPKFVADFIEAQDDPVYEMCVMYEQWGVNGDDGTTSFTEEVAEWFDDSVNVETYYRACLNGYEVEKEKKYYVTLPHTNELGFNLFLSTQFGIEWVEERAMAEQLTEAEIKSVDERYWAFAVPVEEEAE